MTTILAVETSTQACSVALLTADGVFQQYSEEPRSHTKLLMPMVDQVLSEAGLKKADLDGLAVSVGPGSFTGLRIGFGVAQGLAFGLNIPVVAASTLQVLVSTYARLYSADEEAVIFSVLDARMGEFNCGCYKVQANGTPIAMMDDQLVQRSEVLSLIEELKPEAVIGDASILLDEPLVSNIKAQDIYPQALDLLTIGQQRFDSGEARSAESIELVYLRGTEAWKKHKPLRER